MASVQCSDQFPTGLCHGEAHHRSWRAGRTQHHGHPGPSHWWRGDLRVARQGRGTKAGTLPQRCWRTGSTATSTRPPLVTAPRGSPSGLSYGSKGCCNSRGGYHHHQCNMAPTFKTMPTPGPTHGPRCHKCMPCASLTLSAGTQGVFRGSPMPHNRGIWVKSVKNIGQNR